MPYLIKDDTTLQALEQLSSRRGKPKAEVLRNALKRELDEETGKTPIRELLAPLRAKVAALGTVKRMSLEEDKRLSDELWGE